MPISRRARPRGAEHATSLASLAFLMYLLTLLASELILQRKHLARRFTSLRPGHR